MNGAVRRGWLGSAVDVGTSPEFKALGKKVLYTDPIGKLPRFVLERTPGLKPWLMRRIGAGGATVYTPAAADSSDDVLRITPRQATVAADKARRVLGWKPLVDRNTAIERTLEWIHYARIG